jgi:uncharacterized protein
MSFFKETRQKQLFEDVRKFYETHNYDYAHRLDHVARVLWWCIFLSKKEKADLSILIPAAILHDIGKLEKIKHNHAQVSYKMCFRYLKKHGYNRDEIEKISQAILAHSMQHSEFPKTIEEKVLFDADKLDAINPISLHRWFFSYSYIKSFYAHDRVLEEISKDIKKWKQRVGKTPFYTKTAREIGDKGLTYIENVFNDITNDYKKFRRIYKELNIG